MNDAAAVIPVVVKARAKRVRQPRSLQDRLFDLALQHWFEWLLAVKLPRSASHRAGAGADLADAWSSSFGNSRSRSNTEHSDPTLGQILADERAGWDWPVAIHAIVADLPSKGWQIALLGTAMGQSQAVIAQAVGIKQQDVSDMISLIKTCFLPTLLMLSVTEQKCEAFFGVRKLHLRFP